MTFFSCFFGDFLVLPPLFYHKSGEKSVDIYFDLPFIYWLFGVSQSTRYLEAKEEYPGHLAMMLVLDSYEFYGGDAEVLSEVAELPLTSRDIMGIGEVPM
jgi:hypothetical protein